MSALDLATLLLSSGVLGQAAVAFRWVVGVESRLATLERCEEARKRKTRLQLEAQQ